MGYHPLFLLMEPDVPFFGPPEDWELLSYFAKEAVLASSDVDLQQFLEDKAYDLDLYPECFSMEVDEGQKPNELFLGFDGSEPVSIAKMPVATPCEAIAYLPCGPFEGWEACEKTALAKHWQQQYGAFPIAAGFDTLQFAVETPPTDPEELEKLCHEMLLFCPELIEEYGFSFGNLKKMISLSHFWFFRWF